MRRLRREREITLGEISRDTKIAISTLSYGERGLQPFTAKQRETLSEYFGVPEETLFAPVAEAVAP